MHIFKKKKKEKKKDQKIPAWKLWVITIFPVELNILQKDCDSNKLLQIVLKTYKSKKNIHILYKKAVATFQLFHLRWDLRCCFHYAHVIEQAISIIQFHIPCHSALFNLLKCLGFKKYFSIVVTSNLNNNKFITKCMIQSTFYELLKPAPNSSNDHKDILIRAKLNEFCADTEHLTQQQLRFNTRWGHIFSFPQNSWDLSEDTIL